MQRSSQTPTVIRGMVLVIVTTLVATLANSTSAASIYVIGASSGSDVTNTLSGLGHSTSWGGTLTDYSAYDQVWDIRGSQSLTSSDTTAMSAFLASGGRMYITGEIVFARSRNQSIVDFVDQIGGGTLTLHANEVSGSQSLTTPGMITNTPNPLSHLTYSGAAAATTTQGFLVTEDTYKPGYGSTIGWDMGDLSSATDARLLVSFDTQVLYSPYHDNANLWIENAATYLGAPVANPATIVVPLPMPAALGLVGLALQAMVVQRRRRWHR